MISASPATMAYLPLKIVPEGKSPGILRIIKKEPVGDPGTQLKKLKPQQLTAGMAFRLLGLNNMPVYYADTFFLQKARNKGIPVPSAQLLLDFKQANEAAKAGIIYKNSVAEYKSELTTVLDDAEVLSFSKIKDNKEIVIIYNTSETEAKEKFILLTGPASTDVKQLKNVYGYCAGSHVHLFHSTHDGKDISYIKVYLKPLQLIILKND
ncbi:MAG TPA: hypothetical protein VG738_19435 [Chitinophagaceae bacterium]|nr:hypothetical protein [Chitinophagaceae bacterium]